MLRLAQKLMLDSLLHRVIDRFCNDGMDGIISISDELEIGKFDFYKTTDWSFIDGHATRMFWRGKDPVLVKS